MTDVPGGSVAFGFLNDLVGTHTSRTIMLPELRLLLAACAQTATLDDYRAAVVEENVLLKLTVDTRRTTFRYLRERYALDRRVMLFRSLRDLWGDDAPAQPLLAMLCAAARDPLLRTTADIVLPAAKGTSITAEMLAAAIDAYVPGRYNAETLITTGQRNGSSWVQSGHLLASGGKKLRTTAESRPAAVAYALLLGDRCGARGDALFETFWARLLDAPVHAIREQAAVASRHGWIDYRAAGGVTEVGFRHLLRGWEGWT